MTSGPARGSRAPTALALALAALGAVAALAAAGVLPARLVPLGAPLLVFGAALPLLLRWTPVEASALEVGLLASLLSSPLMAALRFGCGSWAIALGIAAGLQVLALGRPPRREAPRRAARGALALASLTAAGLAWLLFAHGWALRLDLDAQVWHAAVAEALLRGGPLENPFLAGTPLPTHPGFAALVATWAEALAWPTASASAALTVGSAATLPVSLYLIAAAVWGEPRRALLTPLLFGLAWGAPAVVGLPWIPDPTVVLGPEAPGLALAAGALLAASHGLRHGRRAWVGLTGLLAGAAFLVDPALGLAALIVPILVAVVAPGVPAVRRAAPVVVLAWALPGLWFLRRYGLEALPVGSGVGGAALVPLGLLALLGLPGGWGRGAAGPGQPGPRRRTLLVLAACGAAVPLALAGALPSHASALARLATLALAPVAAGGTLALFEGRGVARRLAALGVAAVLTLAGVSWVQAARARLQAARQPLAVVGAGAAVGRFFRSEAQLPGDGRLDPRVAASPRQVARAQAVRLRQRALAYRWIREHRAQLGPRPVLWRSLAGWGDRSRGELALHLAPLYAGLPLWCDADPASAAGSARWALRRERVRGLFEQAGKHDSTTMLELERLGRSAVLLVEEADRERTHPRGERTPWRGVDLALERLGAERVHVEGTVAVYRWLPRGDRP